MPFRVDSKNETPKNWSILIALLHEGQLWFIYSGIISPTQWYSYDLRFFYTIVLHNTKFKMNEYKWKYSGSYLFEIFLLRQGKRNSQVYLHKINFPIVLLRVKGRNKLSFDIYK